MRARDSMSGERLADAVRDFLRALDRGYFAIDFPGESAFVSALRSALARDESQGGDPPRDTCGFCGRPGADKVPHPVRWPGENSAGTEYVHAACEDAETTRAHSLLTDRERADFLRWVL